MSVLCKIDSLCVDARSSHGSELPRGAWEGLGRAGRAGPEIHAIDIESPSGGGQTEASPRAECSCPGMPKITSDRVSLSTMSAIPSLSSSPSRFRSIIVQNDPRQSMPEFAIVDLFAGPGGLAEASAALETRTGCRPFKIGAVGGKRKGCFRYTSTPQLPSSIIWRLPPEYYRFLNGETAEPDWSLPCIPNSGRRACQGRHVQLELGSVQAPTKSIYERLAT